MRYLANLQIFGIKQHLLKKKPLSKKKKRNLKIFWTANLKVFWNENDAYQICEIYSPWLGSSDDESVILIRQGCGFDLGQGPYEKQPMST